MLYLGLVSPKTKTFVGEMKYSPCQKENQFSNDTANRALLCPGLNQGYNNADMQ